MNRTLELFLPIVRFAGHSLASAIGFVVLIGVTLIPIVFLRLVASTGLVELDKMFDWHGLEAGIVYLDIGLYVLTVALWALVFVVEEIRAVRKVLGW